MQLMVLLTVALQESTERREYYSLRASSPFFKIWGESREVTLEPHSKRDASAFSHSSQATSVMGNITVWREPSRWGQTRKLSRGKIGGKKKGWDKRTVYRLKR